MKVLIWNAMYWIIPLYTIDISLIIGWLKHFLQTTYYAPTNKVLGGILESAGGRSVGRMVGQSVRFIFLVRDISQNVQEISATNAVGRLILLSRSAMLKNRNSALFYFGVITLCSFLHFEIGPGQNSRTIKCINFVGI
jgi:hypothetical protein